MNQSVVLSPRSDFSGSLNQHDMVIMIISGGEQLEISGDKESCPISLIPNVIRMFQEICHLTPKKCTEVLSAALGTLGERPGEKVKGSVR